MYVVVQAAVLCMLLCRQLCYVCMYVVQAAVLHDTVEDTDTSLEELEKVFGQQVREIVDEVSDDKSLPKMERKKLQVSW